MSDFVTEAERYGKMTLPELFTRLTALEAALRDIEAAWDDDAIPTEDVGARMVLIARAALAPAPAPEVAMPVAWRHEYVPGRFHLMTENVKNDPRYEPLYLAPAPALEGE